jgi:uncharacterized protein
MSYVIPGVLSFLSSRKFLYLLSAVILLSTGLAIYGIAVEPYQIEARHIWIRDEHLAKIFDNKTIVQISDLHIKSIGHREQKALEILNALQPDIIFLTGDYVAWNGDYEPAMTFLSKLNAKIGIWAVMGEYDYSNSRKSCLFCHEAGTGNPSRQHSVRFLRDNFETIKLPEGSLNIAGLDVQKNLSSNSNLWSKLKDSNTSAIVLTHNPLAFDYIQDNNNLLMLAGDTHGGQIPLPGWAFGMIGYKKNALYNQGAFERNGNKLFVTRGIGTSHIPFRLFRRPEIVVLHFIQ